MKKIQMVGVAVAVCSGMAFAQLWTPKAPSGQVQFPWVVECTSSGNFNEEDENDPCYKKMGGFWWGFLYGWEDVPDKYEKQVGPRQCAGAPGQTEIGGPTSATNKVEAFIGGDWVNFNGPDDKVKCAGPDVTDRKTGDNLIGDALKVRMTIGAGYKDEGNDIYSPSGSGIGITMVESEITSEPRDITQYADGFCLTYKSDHENTKVGLENEGAYLVLMLGWNEGYEDPPNARNHFVKGVDGWFAIIPEAPNGQKKTVDFKWTGSSSYSDDPMEQNMVGDFLQDNFTKWGTWRKDGENGGTDNSLSIPPGAPFKIEKATKEMTSVKIVYKGYEKHVVNFELYEFGWAGTCKGGSSPIVASNVKPASPVGFEMIGKTLSMNSTVGKPVAVQVINLQGAVVQSKTMSNGEKLSLQNLPTGIYMIRVPSQNYTVKQIVK